jgi:hypothetical protein
MEKRENRNPPLGLAPWRGPASSPRPPWPGLRLADQLVRAAQPPPGAAYPAPLAARLASRPSRAARTPRPAWAIGTAVAAAPWWGLPANRPPPQKNLLSLLYPPFAHVLSSFFPRPARPSTPGVEPPLAAPTLPAASPLPPLPHPLSPSLAWRDSLPRARAAMAPRPAAARASPPGAPTRPRRAAPCSRPDVRPRRADSLCPRPQRAQRDPAPLWPPLWRARPRPSPGARQPRLARPARRSSPGWSAHARGTQPDAAPLPTRGAQRGVRAARSRCVGAASRALVLAGCARRLYAPVLPA